MAEQTFETFIQSERQRLQKQREELFTQQQEVQDKLDAVNREMDAITAYEKAKKGELVVTPRQPGQTRSSGTRAPRQSGRQDLVLDTIASNPAGMTPAEIKEALKETWGGEGVDAGVSNALNNLKKKGRVRKDDDGKYRPA